MASFPAMTAVRQHPLRRSHPRYTLRSLSYVKLDAANGGIIRDLTARGVALQAVAPLRPGEEVVLRFDLLLPRVHVEVRGRVAWADVSGQAGISFTDLPLRQQRALRDWILVQILSAAVVSGRDSMFPPLDGQIMVSESARPAIEVSSRIASVPDLSVRIRWGLFSLSGRSLSVLVDAMVLACAILIFAISALIVIGAMPPWPLALTLLLTASSVFIATYHLLFSDFLCGASLGKRLASLATTEPQDEAPRQRFR